MKRVRALAMGAVLPCLVAVIVLCGVAAAAEPVFAPLAFNQGNTETHTGMWLCADLGKAQDILPLKTRLWATKESVTGGVALKCLFEPGSKASLNWENMYKFPADAAGLALYAKASRPLKLNVAKAVAEVGTKWKKLDLTWDALGTTKDKRDLGWLLTISVAGPIRERTWLILDRIGTEAPEFMANPKIEPQDGPDEAISSKDILYGAENLAKTLQRARAKKPFRIFAFGDSITLGAQMYRGTWGVAAKDGIPFLWHHHLARLWEEHFGCKGITVVHGGVPGAISDAHLKNLGPFLKDATADDLVILAASTAPAQWKKPLLQMIATAKQKTDQILVMSPPAGSFVVGASDQVTKLLKEVAEEEKVAAADITRFCLYRGEKYAWAGEGNEWHPTYMLSLTMGEMMAPLLTGGERVWPGAPGK